MTDQIQQLPATVLSTKAAEDCFRRWLHAEGEENGIAPEAVMIIHSAGPYTEPGKTQLQIFIIFFVCFRQYKEATVTEEGEIAIRDADVDLN